MKKKNDLFVSIIIPCLNEEDNIKLCIDSILVLDYPKEKIEIIVVDNGSTDGTIDLVREYNVKITYYRGKIGAVRNHGANLAKGDILAYVDGDCVVKVRWLRAAVEELKNDRIGAVGGIPLLNKERANWVERSWVLHPVVKTEYVQRLVTGSFFITKKKFLELKGFNEHVVSGEDTELSQRIIKNGYKLKLLAECAVIHNGYPKTLSGFLKRQIWHTSSYFETIPKRTNPIFLLTHLFLLSLLCTLPSIFLGFHKFLLFSSLTTFSIPLFTTLFKFYKQKWLYIFSAFFGAFIIMTIYFTGRSIGLAISYLRLLR